MGKSTSEVLKTKGVVPLSITAYGQGCRQMYLMDKYGFPRTGPTIAKQVKGFQTGDIVKTCVTSGKNVWKYAGRVSLHAA